MSYPAGVQLAAVRWGSAFTAFGNGAEGRITIYPVFIGTRKVVWEATGDPLVPLQESKTAFAQVDSITQLPVVDQPGWLDDSGAYYNDWSYQADLYYVLNGQSFSESKKFKLLMGQDMVDLDLIFSGNVGLPTAGPMAIVTSINGQIGAVTLPLLDEAGVQPFVDRAETAAVDAEADRLAALAQAGLSAGSATAAAGSATQAAGSATSATASAATASTKAAEAQASAVAAGLVGTTNDAIVAGVMANLDSLTSQADYRFTTGEASVTHAWLGTAHASQSVRKLDGVAVNTNYALTPEFEAVTAGTTLVRTNYCTNPTLEVSSLGYGSAGVTGSTRNAITTLPGFVWAYGADFTAASDRVYWGSSSIIPAGNYTASAWVLGPVGSTVRMAGMLSDGTTTFGFGAATVMTGTWQRLSATFAHPGSTGVRVEARVMTNGFSGRMFMAGIMIEQTDQPRPYFDGNTPDALGFDYSWSGTPGVSTSIAKASVAEIRRNFVIDPRSAAAYPPYAATVPTLATSIPAHPLGITTASRVAYTAGTSNPGVLFGPGYAAGTYTISAYIYQESGAGNNGALAVLSVTTAGGISVAGGIGQWVRHTWTTTLSAGNQVGYRIGSPAVDGSFLITGVQIEMTSGPATSYFDGSSPAVGELMTYWSGAANASASFEAGLVPTNIAYTALQVLPRQARDADGAFVRYLIVGTGAAAIGTAIQTATLVLNNTYTLLMRVRASRNMTATPRLYGNTANPVALPAGVWTEVRVTITAGVYNLLNTGLLFMAGAGHGPGETIDISRVAVVEGVYTGPHFDGSTPPKRVVEAFDARYAPLSVVAGLAAESSRVLVGTGSPQSVVSAPVGTEFIDTNATMGARKWSKVSGIGNTGWIVVDGDTGMRDITALWAGISAGKIILRRINETVRISFVDVVVGGTSTSVGFLPSSFRPDAYSYFPTALITGPSTTKGIALAPNGTTALSSGASGDTIKTSGSFFTDGTWPTTLPGSPA